jgi:protein-S-isoprenylcysteine O-methyltransferase Ste14
MFTVNGIFIGVLTWGTGEVPPMQGLPWLGISLIVIGLGVVVYAMDLFRQFSRWVGNATPGLVTRGLYKFSRNPQSVGYGLAILGMVIAWGGLSGWLGFLSYVVLIYSVVRVEEEHLSRVYGQAYREYCLQIPRFIGLTSKQKTITAEAK